MDHLSDDALHLGVKRARKKESSINVKERISLARRMSYSLMNTGATWDDWTKSYDIICNLQGIRSTILTVWS